MPRERSAGRKPRQIAQHLAKLASPTPRASEMTEALPETNVPSGATVAIESTVTSPGAGGVAVVEVPREIAEHTDDDAHIVVDPETGEGELVEPPTRRRPEGEPDGDGSLEGEANVSDPREGAEGEDPVKRNDDPNAPGSPGGGESMTSERVAVPPQAPAGTPRAPGTPPRKGTPDK